MELRVVILGQSGIKINSRKEITSYLVNISVFQFMLSGQSYLLSRATYQSRILLSFRDFTALTTTHVKNRLITLMHQRP